MDSDLQAGSYIITSKATGYVVGRDPDSSTQPAAVVIIDDPDNKPKWTFARTQHGQYVMKVDGYPTVMIDKYLFTTFESGTHPTLWDITPQPQHGRNVFTITPAGNKGVGWIAPRDDEGDDLRITVRTLITAPTFPPTFPDPELFVFAKN